MFLTAEHESGDCPDDPVIARLGTIRKKGSSLIKEDTLHQILDGLLLSPYSPQDESTNT